MAGADCDATGGEQSVLHSGVRRFSQQRHDGARTNEALLAYDGTMPWFAIQWHGMAQSTCPMTDVYPSHGRDAATAPTDKISMLRQNVVAAHPTWDLDLPGSGMCSLNATENVAGRLLNGVPPENVCTMEASSQTQRFVHIEQDPNFRNCCGLGRAHHEHLPLNTR